MSGGPITLSLRREDYIRATRMSFLAPLRQRPFQAKILLVTVVLASVWTWLFWDATRWWGFAIGMAYMSGLYALLVGVSFLLIPYRAGRLFDQQPSLQRPIVFSWNDEAMFQRSAIGDATIPWADYYRWSVGRGLLLLYMNDKIYHLVPLAAVLPDDSRDLLATAERALGPAGAPIASSRRPA